MKEFRFPMWKFSQYIGKIISVPKKSLNIAKKRKSKL